MSTPSSPADDNNLPSFDLDAELLRGCKLSGHEDPYTARLIQAQHVLTHAGGHTMKPLLPLLFQLNGRPFTLDRGEGDEAKFSPGFAPCETFYRLRTPRWMLLKIARQLSKCRPLTADESVQAENGRPLYPDELLIATRIGGLGDDLKWSPRTVVAKHENPPEAIVRVRTRTGGDVRLTVDHPLLTVNGYVPVSALKPGDRVATLRRGGAFTAQARPGRTRIVLTAYMLGDGCSSNTFGFTSAAGPVYDEFLSLASPLQDTPIKKYNGSGKSLELRLSRKNRLAKWLREDAAWGKRAWEKRLPAWVFDLSRNDTVLFLSRLWATDGMVKTMRRGVAITYCSTSYRLARDVRALLTKLGILAGVYRHKSGYRKHDVYHTCRDAYIVRVATRQGWADFMTQVAVPGKPVVTVPDTVSNNNRDTVPLEVSGLIADVARSIRWKHTNSLHSAGLRLKPQYPITRDKFRAYVEHFRRCCSDHPQLSRLEALLDGDVVWDVVVSIEPAGVEASWDIETDANHNYILDGLVSHNTSTLAARGILQSVSTPNFSTLYVTPLYEQIRRFSANYVRPFIQNSPVKALFVGENTVESVLQRTFNNQSKMIFSFAGISCDRTRGVSTNRLVVDEGQDLDELHLPILRETLSASPYGELVDIAGTPKSLSNTMEKVWKMTSQAEWVMKCVKCGHWNVPSLTHDVERMLGPHSESISYENPGIRCGKCYQRRSIFPQAGRWIHAYPEKRWKWAGYHAPQIIFPMHYAIPDKWATVLSKREGGGNTPLNVFYNEVLGESYDIGSRIITITDLQRACLLPWTRNLSEAEKAYNPDDYACVVLSCDWGGGGELQLSFTVYAVMGIRHDGTVDVIFAYRSLRPHEHEWEAKLAAGLATRFKCQAIVHDYTGAGSLRESFIVGAGYPIGRIVPVAYVRYGIAVRPFQFKPGTKARPRSHYQVDKSRSLLLTCQQIKHQRIQFFKDDYVSPEDEGLLRDFLALMDEKADSRFGADTYTIVRDPALKDDFAQAVNIGAHALWHMTDKWPDLAGIAHMRISDELLAALEPPGRDVVEDIF